MIWLIGMMGSGKSTIGRALAAHLVVPFWDSDDEVEKDRGMTVRRLWEIEGEPALRSAESSVVQKLAQRNEGIVATGGGVVLEPANVEAMRHSGTVIWLRSSPDVLASRITGTARPLLDVDNVQHRLAEILDGRLHLYQRAAHVVIDTDDLAVDEVVAMATGAVS